MTCLLILLGLCHPTRVQFTLSVMTAASAFTDSYATQRNFAVLNPHELNPLARPFVTHGPVLNYSSSAVESLSLAFLAHRMKVSHNWTRHVWWLPQIAGVAGHVYGASYSFNNHRS